MLFILDISKILMYNFHFGLIKQLYPGEKSKMLFIVTGSATYSIKIERIIRRKELFDFSGYFRDSQYYNTDDMKRIDKMKNKTGGVPIPITNFISSFFLNAIIHKIWFIVLGC